MIELRREKKLKLSLRRRLDAGVRPSRCWKLQGLKEMLCNVAMSCLRGLFSMTARTSGAELGTFIASSLLRSSVLRSNPLQIVNSGIETFLFAFQGIRN